MEKDIHLSALKSEILALHNESIQAHLDKDIAFFTRGQADAYISVSRGEIHRPTLKDIETMFSHYLNNTIFSEYRDLQEPLIGISNDGTLAWSVAQVKVAGKRKKEDGTEAGIDFVCSWIMLYKRRNDGWIRIADASTIKN